MEDRQDLEQTLDWGEVNPPVSTQKLYMDPAFAATAGITQ